MTAVVKKPRGKARQKQLDEATQATSAAVFRPVHAASISTPVFDSLVREIGEPNLNPYPPDPGPDFGLARLFEEHRPYVSLREFVPAWAVENTGQYFLDRLALADYVDRMAGEKGDKHADNQPAAANGPGSAVAAEGSGGDLAGGPEDGDPVGCGRKAPRG